MAWIDDEEEEKMVLKYIIEIPKTELWEKIEKALDEIERECLNYYSTMMWKDELLGHYRFHYEFDDDSSKMSSFEDEEKYIKEILKKYFDDFEVTLTYATRIISPFGYGQPL